MALYSLKVYDRNLLLTLGKKEFRTPVELLVSSQELISLKTLLTFYGCKNYEVKEVEKKKDVVIEREEVIVVEKEERKPTYEEVKERVFKSKKRSETTLYLPVISETKTKTEYKSAKRETSFILPFGKLELENKQMKEDFEVTVKELGLKVSQALSKVSFETF